MTERTKAEKLARTLDYLVGAGVIPGLLPADVSAAAELLRDQDKELQTLRAALATKEHIVDVEIVETQPYRKECRATLVISDPRIFHGAIEVGHEMEFMSRDDDWLHHIGRQLIRAGTRDWIRDLEEKAVIGFVRTYRQMRDAA